MSRRLWLFLFVAPAFAQNAVDPRAVQMLPADSAVVIGLQWRQLAQSPAAKSFQQQLNAAIPMITAKSGVSHFQDFLMNQLDSILVAIPASAATQLTPARATKPGTKAAPQNPPLLVVLKGRFNLARVRELAKEKKGETEVYQDFELLRLDSKPPMRMVVVDGATMVIGTRKDVVGAIDRRKGTTPSPEVSQLTARLTNLAAANDLFVSAEIPASAFAGKEVPPAMAAFRDVSSFDLGLSFQQGMAMKANLQAKTDQSAKTLASTLQMLMLLASQNEKNPEAAEMVNRVAIAAAGRSVTLGLTLSQAELEKMARQRPGQQAPPSFSGPPRVSGPGEVKVSQPSPAGETPNKAIRITGLDGGPVEIPANSSGK